MMKKRKNIVKLCALLLLVFLFSACYDTAERSGEFTSRETSTNDIPVIAPLDPPAPKKRVALTFDDGPNHHEDRTKSIVDELSKYGYHATFFVVGNRVAGGNALSYAVEHGNEIGIHGYTHDVYYDSCTEDEFRLELNKTAQAIRAELPEYEINLMRPVGGKITDKRVQTCSYAVILWSVDSLDYENKYYPGISDELADERVATTVENVMSAVNDGDIILMHDIYQSTYDAVKIILQRLYEEGYEVVTVSELLGDDLRAGQEYSYALN